MKSIHFETCRILAFAVLLLGVTRTIAEEPAAASSPPDLTKVIDFERTGQYHLGPTGAKGWMVVTSRFMTDQARQILVTEVEEGTPADGVLQVGDVILGVGDAPFDRDARKSFGRAIDEAEKSENHGILKLIRWRPDPNAATRQGTQEVVQLQLKVMGTYSDTAPYDCPKSKKILEDALKVLTEQEDWGRFGLAALALLATGEEEHIERVRDYIHEVDWAKPDITIRLDSGGLVCWGVGYRNLVLTEYYLATGDEYVLPAIREYAVKTAMGQSSGGTWGHGFAWTSQNEGRLHGRLSGYGALNQAGLPCLLSMILSKKCGIEHPEIDDAIAKATRFFSKFVGNGSIGYGFHRPSLEIHANGRNGMSANGKNGIAAVVFSLQGRTDDSQFFSKLTTSLYNTCEYGHSGNSYSYFWDLLGANCGGPEAVAALHKELRWYFALTRQADGRFVYQRLGGHYGGELLDPTVAQVLSATLSRRAIHLTGKGHDRSAWLGDNGAEEAIAAGRWRLADTGDMSAQQLIDRLDCWSPIAREWIAKSLAKKDGNFTPQLIDLLKSDKPEARAGACAALGHMGERSAAAVPAISQALTDEEAIVCIAAGYAIARINAPARKAVPDMLRAILAAKEEGLMLPTQQALAFSLGHAPGRVAPLYFDGLVPSLAAEGGDPLEGIDRELLYPTVAKLLKTSAGRTRGCGAYLLKFFTREDTAAMAQNIYDAIVDPPPNYLMFDDNARQHCLDLMVRFRIKEGIPLCLRTLDADRWGKGVRTVHRFNTLREYGGAAKPYLPRLRDLRWDYRTDADRHTLEDAIRAIEEDDAPQPLVSLHTLVDERLAKDLASAKHDGERVQLCRRFMKDNSEDYFYQAACLRRITPILGLRAFGDIEAALQHPSNILSETAVNLSADLPDEADRLWFDRAITTRDKRLTNILRVLSRTGDRNVLQLLRQFSKFEDETVRNAAIRGFWSLGRNEELPLLIDLLVAEESERCRESIEAAILSVCDGSKKGISPLLTALAETPQIPTDEAARCSLLRVLGQFGGKQTLAALIGATADESVVIREAAFEALGTFSDPKATRALLTLAEETEDRRVRSEVVMVCLRRVITDRVPRDRKIRLLKKLLTLDENSRTVSAVLAEFQWLPSIDSLRLAQSYLSEPAISETAATTAVAIAQRMDMSDKQQRSAAAGVVRQALEATKNETTTADAEAFLLQYGE